MAWTRVLVQIKKRTCVTNIEPQDPQRITSPLTHHRSLWFLFFLSISMAIIKAPWGPTVLQKRHHVFHQCVGGISWWEQWASRISKKTGKWKETHHLVLPRMMVGQQLPQKNPHDSTTLTAHLKDHQRSHLDVAGPVRAPPFRWWISFQGFVRNLRFQASHQDRSTLVQSLRYHRLWPIGNHTLIGKLLPFISTSFHFPSSVDTPVFHKRSSTVCKHSFPTNTTPWN